MIARTSVVVLMLGLVAAQKPLNVTLTYVPTDNGSTLTSPLPPSVLDRPAEIRIEDARVDLEPTVIGEGNDGGKLYRIQALGDPVKYLRETLLRIAGSQGLKTASPGGRQFRVRVVRFWINHSDKAIGAMYNAEVSLAYSLTEKAGSVLAEGAQGATATRYGKGHSPDNCNETLSDALKEAFLKVLDDQKLRDAWKIS